MSRPLALRPAAEQAALVRDRVVGCRELLELHLERVARLDPALNAVCTLAPDRARQEADLADLAVAAGCRLGPLHGLPVTVKDSIETAGIRTVCGDPGLLGHVPAQDALAVRRLRDAGAIVFGKTNVPTWASDCQSSNPVFGTTNNPWDVTRTPGGSSGGEAAAVATGLTPLGTGSDLGGSLRLPASFCGVFALKPSYGVVPFTGHLPPAPGTLAPMDVGSIGSLARSAEDLDLALRVLAGPDDVHAAAWRLVLPEPAVGSLESTRLGVWLDDPVCPVGPSTGGVLEDVVGKAAAAGAQVVDLAAALGPLAEEAYLLAQALIHATVAPHLPDEVYAEALGARDADGAHGRWARGLTASARELGHLLEQREQLALRWRAAVADVDVLLTPVTPGPAFPHDDRPEGERVLDVDGVPRPFGEQFAWMQVVGALRLPAVSAPVGRTAGGLPVGVQVVAPYLHDRTAIAVGGWLSDLVGGFEPPPLAYAPAG